MDAEVRWILGRRRYAIIKLFYLFPDWLFQYYNELTLVEAIESDYLVWKSEQHRLAPKYYIMPSLVPPIKHYNVNMVEYYNQFKITCQRFNGFVTCSGRSGELLYVTFLHAGMSTLVLYP